MTFSIENTTVSIDFINIIWNLCFEKNFTDMIISHSVLYSATMEIRNRRDIGKLSAYKVESQYQ